MKGLVGCVLVVAGLSSPSQADPIDIVVMIDASDSVGTTGFALAKALAADLVDAFAFGPTQANMATGRFAGSTVLDWQLSSAQSLVEIKQAISVATFLGGEPSDLGSALAAAQNQFANLGRADADKLLVLVTDGHHTAGPESDVVALAQDLAGDGVLILAVTLGSSPNDTLLESLGAQVLAPSQVSTIDFENLQFPDTSSGNPVPEPGTLVLIGLAASGAFVLRRRAAREPVSS
jgi:Mg-chelatase subunit ChlD